MTVKQKYAVFGAGIALAIGFFAAPAFAENCSANFDGNGAAFGELFAPGGGSTNHIYAKCADAIPGLTKDDLGDAVALSAALPPIWLENGENYAIAGGLGGAEDGDVALGLMGVARVSGNASAYFGGATTTDGDGWLAKGGMRFGFK